MREFATRDLPLFTGPADLLSRLLACALPAITFSHDQIVMSAAVALFLGLMDGSARLWGSCTSRSFIAEPEGLKITSGFSVQVVRWANILAIRTWHHFNRIDYLAVHYRRAGRIQVATCLDQCARDDLRSFVCACADYVNSDAPRQSITLAGLGDQGIYLPLFRRFTQDVAIATLVGHTVGVVGPAFLLGILAASLSAFVAAIRHPFRTTTLVQRGGLWCSQGVEALPLRTIPRALRLWVRCLDEAAYRGA